MELRYPWVLGIVFFLVIIIVILYRKRSKKYKNGSKIANTSYVKESKYYQKLINRYKLIINIIKIFLLIIIFICSLLIARLSKVETTDLKKYNRDIILCMDVSSSVNDLNQDLVGDLKDTVKSLNGERFGISIFNGSSVTLVPLTDDYEYVLSVLDNIEDSLDSLTSNSSSKSKSLYTRSYITSGTNEVDDNRGSSLIGDGLASCVYNFSSLEDKRTRIIIFSTDNELAGTPIVTLDEAASISKSKKIKVFGIGTKNMSTKNRNEFEAAVLKTDGKFYEHSKNATSEIVEDIEKTSKTLLKNQNVVKKVDKPEILFVILTILLICFFIISKKVEK